MSAFARFGYNIDALLDSAGIRDIDLDDPVCACSVRRR